MFLRNRIVEKVSDPLFSRNEREDYPMCDTRYLAVQSESLVSAGPVSLVPANTLLLLAFVIFVFAHIISMSSGNLMSVWLCVTSTSLQTTNNMQHLFRLSVFFKSDQHISGDKFAYSQEHFLTVYTAFGTMHRHCCRPVHCTKSCINSQKVLLRMGVFVVRNTLGWFKNNDKRKRCCMLLVVCNVVFREDQKLMYLIQ